jgi:hypothetical protein
MGDDAGRDVRLKQAVVQIVQLDNRGEPELAGLQQEVKPVLLVQELLLQRTELEGDRRSVLVLDRVEAVPEPRQLVGPALGAEV